MNYYGIYMEKLFIKITLILSILILLWIILIVCKKMYYLLKNNKKEICYRIIQPDMKGVLYYFILILALSLINIMVYRLIFFQLSYEVYGVYWEELLIISIPIFSCFLLLICNEFFPAIIITKEYICWRCQKVYQKEKVTFSYDKEKIFLYCDEKKLVINRRKKYESLIGFLDTYYKK